MPQRLARGFPLLLFALVLFACGPQGPSEADLQATARALGETEAAVQSTNSPVPTPTLTSDPRVFQADDPEADGLKCETALPLPADIVTEVDLRHVAALGASGGPYASAGILWRSPRQRIHRLRVLDLSRPPLSWRES